MILIVIIVALIFFSPVLMMLAGLFGMLASIAWGVMWAVMGAMSYFVCIPFTKSFKPTEFTVWCFEGTFDAMARRVATSGDLCDEGVAAQTVMTANFAAREAIQKGDKAAAAGLAAATMLAHANYEMTIQRNRLRAQSR